MIEKLKEIQGYLKDTTPAEGESENLLDRAMAIIDGILIDDQVEKRLTDRRVFDVSWPGYHGNIAQIIDYNQGFIDYINYHDEPVDMVEVKQ